MRQFILPEDWEPGAPCRLEGGRARYLGRVLRLERGARFPGLDREGGRWLCEVLEAGPDRVVLAVSPRPDDSREEPLPDVRGGGASAPRPGARGRDAEPSPGAEGRGAEPGRAAGPPPIVLVQAVLKSPKMDLVVRQASEAGISGIVPLEARRSVPSLTGGSVRLARWRRIAREALQQSGSAIPTRIEEPVRPEGLPPLLDRILPAGGRVPRILLHEAPLAQASLHGYLTEAPDAVVLCVGPEGGFAPEELDLLGTAGFQPIRFAGAILRAETAALYAVAAVQTILSERSSWTPAQL